LDGSEVTKGAGNKTDVVVDGFRHTHDG
jgi:hypothetical protein